MSNHQEERLKKTIIPVCHPNGWFQIFGSKKNIIVHPPIILEPGERLADENLRIEQVLLWEGQGHYRIRPDATRADMLDFLALEERYNQLWRERVISEIAGRDKEKIDFQRRGRQEVARGT